jgi:hypothetical protein
MGSDCAPPRAARAPDRWQLVSVSVPDALPAGALITEVVIVPALTDDGSPPVQLLPDLSLCRLDPERVREYVRACNPANLHFAPYEDGGHRYAFVRHPVQTTLNKLHAFDEDDVLHSALALSRYFALNSHCTQYAARRIEGVYDNKPLEIKAVEPESRFYAWHVADGSRSFLTNADAPALGRLLTQYLAVKDRLPPRVRHAIWFCEYSFRQRYYELAMINVVTALESLLKVDKWDASRQFRTRVPMLAREVGITGVTQQRARTFYGRRSHTVHGKPVRVDRMTPATRELALMQRLLTRTLRKTIEDPSFRATFTGPRIKARWPV